MERVSGSASSGKSGSQARFEAAQRAQASSATRPKGEGRRGDPGWYVIRLEGYGYVFNYSPNSYLVEGFQELSHYYDGKRNFDEWFRDHARNRIPNPCEVRTPGMPEIGGGPQVWASGPRVAIVAGPFKDKYYSSKNARGRNWKRKEGRGPSLGSWKSRQGCR
jgi:hypothetical protein